MIDTKDELVAKFETILREHLGAAERIKIELPTLARYLAGAIDLTRRERLPDTRKSITRKFKLLRPGHKNGDLRMYVTVGLYPDGRPGEIFIRSDRLGSFASGTLDAMAMVLSVAWQHGVPFQPVVEKLRGTRFEPQGATGDQTYGIVSSPLDYIAKWLLRRFGKLDETPSDDQNKSKYCTTDRPPEDVSVLEFKNKKPDEGSES